MPIFATAGSKVYIGGQHDDQDEDFVLADFDGESWTAINKMESIGSFGDSAEVITFDDINANRRKKIKGTRDAGNMELIAGIDYADAGQLALIAAEKTEHNYAVKVVFNDAPAGGTPSERYFVGIVMTAGEALDTANNVMKLNASIAINSNIVRVAAAAGGS